MFSGFQVNSFQGNAFQIVRSAVARETTGGFSDRDIKKYRKHLENLERVTRVKDVSSKVIAAAQEIVDVIPDAVPAPEVAKIAADINVINIDFDALAAELARIDAYLSGLYRYNNMMYDYNRELDDELALLLMVT